MIFFIIMYAFHSSGGFLQNSYIAQLKERKKSINLLFIIA